MGQVGRVGKLLAACAAMLALAAAPDDAVARVRAWRAVHETQTLRELFDFLALPNVAANKADIERNAQG